MIVQRLDFDLINKDLDCVPLTVRAFCSIATSILRKLSISQLILSITNVDIRTQNLFIALTHHSFYCDRIYSCLFRYYPTHTIDKIGRIQ